LPLQVCRLPSAPLAARIADRRRFIDEAGR